ncbi:MAG: hypothetical protein IPK80_30055 [Nannocystis sp.]|nr:hypothetical protein [Nannocystis sp.]
MATDDGASARAGGLRMRTKFSKYTSSLALAAVLSACAGGTGGTGGGDQALRDHLKETWGIALSQFDNLDTLVGEDGTQVFLDDGVITVDGLGEYEVSTETIISPASQGGQVSFFVSNPDLSDQRYFLYDQVENYITIGDLTRGVAVSKNPDGTYDVWAFDGDAMDSFSTVPNGFEALKLVEQYNEFKTLPPYLLLTAFAAAHNATPEARIPLCNINNSCPKGQLAAQPPVCELFKEFCDCAACLVLDRQGACDLCPDL